MKLGLYGIVLAGIVGGGAAWASAGRTIDLRIDGADRTVHTSAGDVRGVLEAAHVSVGEHDLVAPDLQAPVKNGAEVVVRRGHLLQLSVNGQLKEVWVNADSVDQALSQLGYDSRNLASVSRSERLDDGTTRLSVDSPKKVTIKADGKSVTVVTGGPTVYEAISDANIYLGPADRLTATVSAKRISPAGPLKSNEVFTIKRVTYGQSVQIASVPFSVQQENDATSFVGSNSVLRQGVNGSSRITFQLIYLDGKLIGRVPVSTKVLKPATSEIKKVGTEQAPTFVATASGTAQKIAAGMVAARGWGNDQFSCLVSLWSKESGWRTDASNPSGAYGIPQALPGDKMATVGPDWQTNAATQITWGLNYISGTYGTPCAAWAHSQADNWY